MNTFVVSDKESFFFGREVKITDWILVGDSTIYRVKFLSGDIWAHFKCEQLSFFRVIDESIPSNRTW